MKSFYEAIIAEGGFAGQVFDVTQGDAGSFPDNTDIIDVLLSVGNGTLTGNAPVNIISTGLLNAARSLTITATEQNGRFFFLSVRNTDITTNNLTVVATTDINGGGASFVISSARDFLFVHETGGTWRAYEQKENLSNFARVFRGTFTALTWSAGTANQITIVQTGAPAAGQIGPHGLAIASSYVVQVYRDSDNKLVDTGVIVNGGTGNITLTKTGLGQDFAGRVIVVGT